MSDHELWMLKGIILAIEDLGGRVTRDAIVFDGPTDEDSANRAWDLSYAVKRAAAHHGFAGVAGLAALISGVCGEYLDIGYGLDRPRGRPRRVH